MRAERADLRRGVGREAGGHVRGVEVIEHPVEDRGEGGVVERRLGGTRNAGEVVATSGTARKRATESRSAGTLPGVPVPSARWQPAHSSV